MRPVRYLPLPLLAVLAAPLTVRREGPCGSFFSTPFVLSSTLSTAHSYTHARARAYNHTRRNTHAHNARARARAHTYRTRPRARARERSFSLSLSLPLSLSGRVSSLSNTVSSFAASPTYHHFLAHSLLPFSVSFTLSIFYLSLSLSTLALSRTVATAVSLRPLGVPTSDVSPSSYATGTKGRSLVTPS